MEMSPPGPRRRRTALARRRELLAEGSPCPPELPFRQVEGQVPETVGNGNGAAGDVEMEVD